MKLGDCLALTALAVLDMLLLAEAFTFARAGSGMLAVAYTAIALLLNPLVILRFRAWIISYRNRAGRRR